MYKTTKAATTQMLQDVERERAWSSGKLTGRFDLREEGSHLLALHNVSDDMTCHFGVGAICDNHGGATLQGPEGSLDLQKRKRQKNYFKVSTWHIFKREWVVTKQPKYR